MSKHELGADRVFHEGAGYRRLEVLFLQALDSK